MTIRSRAPFTAWLVLLLLMLASVVSFVDRQILAIVVEPIKSDLELSDAEVGWLYGIFAVFYAIAAVPLGFLADRRSRKTIIAVGIGVWSLMTMACGLSKTFWHLMLARIGVGVGEASLSPSTVSMVGDLFPSRQIPLALSVFQTAAVMGSGAAFIIGGLVLELVRGAEPLTLPFFGVLAPWQQTFIYVGLPGLALALVFCFLREPSRKSTRQQQGGAGEIVEFYRANWRVLTLHHFGFLSFALLGYAFVFWSVPYFVRVHQLEAASAAQTFGWIFLLTGPIGPVLAALFANHLVRRGQAAGNIVAGMLAGMLAVPCIVLIQFAPTPAWAFALYVPAMIFVNAPFGLANGALPVIAPGRIHAQVAAVYLLVVSLGNLLGPPIAGYFNDTVFPQADGVRYSIIWVCVLFGVLGSFLLLAACKPYARLWRQARNSLPDSGSRQRPQDNRGT